MAGKNSSKSIFQLEKSTFKRVLNLGDLFAIGYGDLGSSIYYALGITALYALGATPIALGLAGIVFVCTALTYAEMSSIYHDSGGSASFARHAFNDLISFFAGWGLMLDYIVTIAISAFAVIPYLAYFYPSLKQDSVEVGFGIGIIFVLFFINVRGVKQSTRMSLVLTVFTILTQITIILIGLFFLLNLPQIIDHLRINVPKMDWSPTWPQFWKGTAMAMVAYTGIESIAQLGAEAKKPAHTVPRAIMMTMFVLVLMYLGISVAALSAISPQELSTTYLEDPVAGIVAHLPFGKKMLGPWLGILAALLLFVSANAGLVGASRLSFKMGEYYQLPRFFYKIHEKHKTPYISLLFFAALASFLILASQGELTFLADLYNFGAMFAFFFAHLSLIVIRIKKPEMKRPFRIRGNLSFRGKEVPITAIIGCLATFSVWVLTVITKPAGRYLGLAWMIVGAAMYLYYRKRHQIPATGQLSIESVAVPHYENLKITKILLPIRGGTQTETIQIACEFAERHGAKLIAVHVVEVPYSLPLDAPLLERAYLAEIMLKRASAIAREFNISLEMNTIRARSTVDAILEVLREDSYDLLIIGAMKGSHDPATKGLGSTTEKIIKEAPCRVWVCASDLAGNPHSDRLLS